MEFIRQLPVSAFAIVMGLAGIGLAWQQATPAGAVAAPLGEGVLCLAALVFVVLLVAYMIKALRFPERLREELLHPVRRNFFAAITIGMILLGTGATVAGVSLGKLAWGVGVGLHLLVTLYAVASWMNHTRYEVHQINPTWFLPAVGNILVPIAGVPHGLVDVSWFFFSIGLVFWLILVTIIVNRMIFHDPLPERLLPTLFILIVPPAAGFVAYMALTDSFDAFARVLYNTGLFFTLLLVTQARRFGAVPFSLSWWAYSFPMAAITLATMRVAGEVGGGYQALAMVLLAMLSVIGAGLVVRTALGIARGELNDEP